MTDRKDKYAMEAKPLGIGGQAEVFPARDKRTGQRVAIKRLVNRDEESIARMRREIEVQTSLAHPNVMPVLDHSTTYVWYAMPIASEILGRVQTPIDDNILFDIVIECARGLLASHSKGYIHRDLTPNNILFLSDVHGERWVVSDWGLVRQHGKTTIVRTLKSQEFGTAGFAAPELWTNAHNADGRADIYSLGRVVGWCLTGQWPAPNIPLIPPGRWGKFVELTTDLQPNKRIQSIEGVIQYVEKLREETRRFSIDSKPISEIPSLTIQDSMVFKSICDVSIQRGTDWIGLEEIQNMLVHNYLEESDFLDSIELLAGEGFIKGSVPFDSKAELFQITPLGFEKYATTYLPKFENLLQKMLVRIIQEQATDNKSLSSIFGEPQILIDYGLMVLETKRFLAITRTFGGKIVIDNVTARGRRAAQQ